MTELKSDAVTNVVRLHPAKASRASEQKWGAKVMALGFCIVPSLLLRAQQRLGLNPTQLAVLMQLCDFWWEDARKPHPGKKLLAERLSLSERQVQRYVAELEQAGLVQRVGRNAPHGGKMTNTYDLSGLVERLKVLEPEFRRVEDEVKSARKAVAKRSFKPRAKPSAKEATAQK